MLPSAGLAADPHAERRPAPPGPQPRSPRRPALIVNVLDLVADDVSDTLAPVVVRRDELRRSDHVDRG
jgi:hypothetical protein